MLAPNGNFRGRAGQAGRAAEKSLEGCQAERQWIRNWVEDASRRAYNALAGDDMRAVKAVEGTTAWSLEALMGIKPTITESFGRQPLRSEA